MLEKLFAKKFSKDKLAEILNFKQTISAEIFKLAQVKGNTARVTNGVLWAKQQEEIVVILQETFTNYMAGEITRLGFKPGTPCHLDYKTGKVWKQ